MQSCEFGEVERELKNCKEIIMQLFKNSHWAKVDIFATQIYTFIFQRSGVEMKKYCSTVEANKKQT